MIIWSSVTPEGVTEKDGRVVPSGEQQRTFAVRTRDFKTFTQAKLFYSPKSGMSVIDPAIAHDDQGTADKGDDRWVMVIKNEMSETDGGKNLRLLFSDRMQGPYDAEPGPPIVGAGTTIVDQMGEGPSLSKHNNLWRLYWDAPFSKFSYCLATSPDLKHWTNRSTEMSLPLKQMRHGVVLPVPAKAVQRAITTKPSPGK